MRHYFIYEPFNIKSFLSNIVMATIPIASQITMSENNRTDSDTDLSIINTEDEMHMDLSTWTPAERKKLKHMTGFHEEYQHVFGEKSFYLYHNEMKNFPYESTYSQICL